MKLRFRYLLAAGAVAALVGAPVATADDPDAGCGDTTGPGTECTTPGNVQIDDAPAAVADPVLDGAYPGPYQVPFDEGSR